MAYIVGILIAIIIIQEIRVQRLVDRLLLQANVPDIYKPTPAAFPGIEAANERIEKRKKLFSVTVPR